MPPPEIPAREPAVSIRRHATLPEALDAVQRATGGLVLSQKAGIERKLQVDIVGAPLSEALQQISQSFDLYWVRKPGGILFQRRYSDPQAEVELDLEEMTAAASDLYRLIHSFTPKPVDITIITDKKDFVKSLTGEQIQAMQTTGLPFGALSPEQRRLWLTINNMQGYGDTDMYLERLVRVFSTWKQGILAQALQGEGYTQYDHLCPDSSHPTSFQRVPLIVNAADAGPLADETGAGTLALLEARQWTSAFRRPLRIADGEYTVAQLVGQLEAATDKQVRIPEYARERRVLVRGGRAQAAELLAGLERLYGWTLRQEKHERYSLSRPFLPPARDAWDLHQKMQAALPPALRYLVAQSPQRKNRRQSYQLGLVLGAVSRKQPRGWTRASAGDLDPDMQRRLGQVVCVALLSDPYCRRLVNDTVPYYWLAVPERGVFTWKTGRTPEGAPGPAIPLLLFSVERPDGKIDQWGWGVGGSSLDK
jgi:hypothetical protein